MNKVLVIEDSVAQGLDMKMGLEEQNFQVVVATTVFEAFHALKETTPDLIILDTVLPGVDGIELCRTLKKDYQTRNVPIIMFSNDNKLHNMIKAYEAGTDYFIVKDEESSKALLILADSLRYRKQRRLSLSA
ncbi:MAG: phoB [Chloroflexi bacterium]|jgi:PleD family two-component response regulator|nr:phoB [Chloroflexota bacterium]